MFVGGSFHTGMSSADEYLFHFHETHESGKFYYLWLMVPILEVKIEDNMWYYLTYRTSLDTSGSFRIITEKDGIQYETIISNNLDKSITAKHNNVEEKFEEFLEMFVENNLYKEIPEIKTLIKDYPNLLI